MSAKENPAQKGPGGNAEDSSTLDRSVTHEVNHEAIEELRLHLWHQQMIDRLHHGRVFGHVTPRESEARHNLYARLYRRQVQGRSW